MVDDKCLDDNLDELAKQVDVIFTATPQGYLASVLSEEILSQVKVIDLSADYRIKDVATYEKWYGIEHKSPQFIPEEQLGYAYGDDVMISFTPHLAPMNRGILATAYATLNKVEYPDGHMDYPTEEMLYDVYHKAYDNEYFVRILEVRMTPETKWSRGF